MSWFADLPVKRKLSFAMVLTSTVVLLLACGVFLAVEYVGYRRNMVRTIDTLARISADDSTAAIAFGDKRGARQNLEALRAEPQVIAATLYDDQGRIFARYSSRPEEMLESNPAAPAGVRLEQGYIIAVQPVEEGSRRLGTLYLQATLEQIYARMRTYALFVLGVLGASFGVAGLIAAVLRRTLAQPILELANTAGAVASNQDYSLRARQYGRDELGQLTATFNAMLDTTQAAVDNLRESEWAHRELVRSLPTAAYMCDPQGVITIFNDAAVALWGRTPELGREYWCGSYRIFRPDGTPLPLDQCPMARSLREGRAVRGEEIIIERPDGTRRNVLPHPEPIRDTAGELVGIVNMLVDITDRKHADAAVHRLAAIVESSDDAIIGKDLNSIVTSWNKGAERLFGYTAAEMCGRSITLLIPPEHQDEETVILRRLRRGESIEHYETVRVRKDESPVDVSLTISPIKDRDGRIIGASKIARDITDRIRHTRQADFLVQLGQELGLLADPAEIMRTASRAVGELLGTDRCYFCTLSGDAALVTVSDDWARKGFAPINGVHQSRDFGTPELWHAMARGPLAVDNKSTHPFTRDLGAGYDRLRIAAHATAPYLNEGVWIASIAVTAERPRTWRKDELDLLENIISRVWPMIERARSQAALRESELRQRRLMRALPVPCFTLDEQGRLTFFNDAAASLWGRVPPLLESKWGGAVAMTTLDGSPLPPEESPVAVALREKRPVRGVETIVIRPDGTRRWTVPYPDPILDVQGNCIGVVNVVMDVTEERSAHEKVQKAAERLNLAIAAANLGDWNWDAATDLIALSPRTAEIYGVPVSPEQTRSAMRELLHPEDRARARLALWQAVETRTDYDIEYRVIRPDGALRWVAATGRSFFGSDGRVSGMVGVVQDITERKQQAEALEQLAARIESQARLFDATLSNLTDLAYAFDREGRYIFANKPQLQLWGRRLEEIVGKNTFDLGYPPAIAQRIDHEIREVVRTGAAVRGEASLTAVNGKTDDHEYILNPVLAPDGSVTAVVGSTRLITERKHAEEALRQREAQLRLVTDNAPILLVRTDREDRFIFVNRAYAERNGYSVAEMIGMKVADAVGEEAYAAFKPHMHRALGGERVEFEIEVPYSRLGRRWVHVIYVPEKDALGRVIGLLGVLSDVGARKQAENELKRARDEAIAASRAKDDFLAALSHELRTPLNPVLLLASDAASNERLDPAVRADFELILKNVNLEARLIDDLLDLTRITRGKLNLQQRRCNVHTILQDALANVKAELDEKKLDLKLDLRARRSRVRGDSVRLQQVFWNILKNAVKFTPEGGQISVTTRLGEDGHTLVLRIADTGIGMTPAEIERVFEAFSQGDHASAAAGTHRFGGLGLGLAITKMLVELHHGQIRAFSEGRDRGSVFNVELPVYADGPDDVSVAPAKPAALVLPPPPPPAGSRPAVQRRILLVEDHAPTRLTLQHLLRQRHFAVSGADSAATAEQLARAGEFDLVISDVGLPDRSGYDLMSRLRALKPDLPGIALSGYGMDEDIARSHAAGFFLHLVKPVTIGMLEEAIASLPRTTPTPQSTAPAP